MVDNLIDVQYISNIKKGIIRAKCVEVTMAMQSEGFSLERADCRHFCWKGTWIVGIIPLT